MLFLKGKWKFQSFITFRSRIFLAQKYTDSLIYVEPSLQQFQKVQNCDAKDLAIFYICFQYFENFKKVFLHRQRYYRKNILNFRIFWILFPWPTAFKWMQFLQECLPTKSIFLRFPYFFLSLDRNSRSRILRLCYDQSLADIAQINASWMYLFYLCWHQRWSEVKNNLNYIFRFNAMRSMWQIPGRLDFPAYLANLYLLQKSFKEKYCQLFL